MVCTLRAFQGNGLGPHEALVHPSALPSDSYVALAKGPCRNDIHLDHPRPLFGNYLTKIMIDLHELVKLCSKMSCHIYH